MKLSLGDAVEIEGQEYVIISYQVVHDAAGRSISFFAKDPLLAQSMLEESRQQRDVLELAAAHLRDAGTNPEHGKDA